VFLLLLRIINRYGSARRQSW